MFLSADPVCGAQVFVIVDAFLEEKAGSIGKGPFGAMPGMGAEPKPVTDVSVKFDDVLGWHSLPPSLSFLCVLLNISLSLSLSISLSLSLFSLCFLFG